MRELTLLRRDDAFAIAGPGFRAEWRDRAGVLTLDSDMVATRAGAYRTTHAALLAVHTALQVEAGGVLLHAAVLAVAGDAYVVAGASGAGKSTLARRFAAHALNEEFAFIAPGPTGWQLNWYGERRGPTSERPAVLPLASVALIEQSAKGTRTRLNAAEAVTALWPHCTVFDGAAIGTLDALAALVTARPVYRFGHALSDSDAAALACLTESWRPTS